VDAGALKVDLIGTWKSEPSETEWGLFGMTCEFRTNGMVHIASYDPQDQDQQVLPREATYRVQGKHIVSEAFGGFDPEVEFWFEGPVLVIKFDSESVYRFKRR